jgi:Amidohydrolase family
MAGADDLRTTPVPTSEQGPTSFLRVSGLSQGNARSPSESGGVVAKDRAARVDGDVPAVSPDRRAPHGDVRTVAKIGPPLRRADGPDREALWQGVARGEISTAGSDHAPRPPQAKEPGWKNIFVYPDGKPIPFGAPSVETMVPLMYSEGVVKRGPPLTWMARVLAENPARIFGIYPRKGAIRIGADADLLLIDPEREWTMQAVNLRGIAGMTFYEGFMSWGYLPGRLVGPLSAFAKAFTFAAISTPSARGRARSQR